MSYKSDLQKRLKDTAYCAGYLSAAMEDSNEAFLVALRDVADAKAGMSELASVTQLNRESLYKLLSQYGNPRLTSLTSILAALGLRIKIEAAAEAPARVAATAAQRHKAQPASSVHPLPACK